MSVTQAQKVDYAYAVAFILRKALRDKQQGMPETVWHYTSCATLVKILESKSLWATHVSCVNDTSEVRHLFDLLFARFDVGGGANPRINRDVFVTDHLRCPHGLPLSSLGTDPGPHCA
jgi:hypothetical protein